MKLLLLRDEEWGRSSSFVLRLNSFEIIDFFALPVCRNNRNLDEIRGEAGGERADRTAALTRKSPAPASPTRGKDRALWAGAVMSARTGGRVLRVLATDPSTCGLGLAASPPKDFETGPNPRNSQLHHQRLHVLLAASEGVKLLPAGTSGKPALPRCKGSRATAAAS
jgi:hypothetical protein